MRKYEQLIEMITNENISTREKISNVLRALRNISNFSQQEIERLFEIIKVLDRVFD